MANAVYPKYKQSILSGDASSDLTQSGATVAPFVAMVDTGTYTYNASHQYYSSLSGLVGTDQQITTPTTTSGVFDGDDVTYTAVSGSSVEAFVIYRKNAGANTTWRLVIYEDTAVTGLPVTPNGGNITITWNASGIFLISDIRLKQDITQIGKCMDIGVYEFAYIGTRERVHGLMAQEVEKVLPCAVIEFQHRDGVRKAVNYNTVQQRLAA